MTITINGSGTITGVSAGGLPSGTVTQATLATSVAGTGPAFSAYPSGSQTITSSTFTKVQYNTEEFDTNSNYDNATNYRFTPTVAGYYSFTAAVSVSTNVTRAILSFYKNGTAFKTFDMNYAVNNYGGATLIYLNGSTDYVELYAYLIGVTPSIAAGPVASFFQASMVRSA